MADDVLTATTDASGAHVPGKTPLGGIGMRPAQAEIHAIPDRLRAQTLGATLTDLPHLATHPATSSIDGPLRAAPGRGTEQRQNRNFSPDAEGQA